MAIVEINSEIIQELKEIELSKGILDNCLNSKFLAIKKENKKIIGVCFVAGMLNNEGIEILKEFRGKGFSKILLNEVLDECKKQKIPFLTTAFKPTNKPSVKIHIEVGYIPIFTFNYNKLEGQEIVVILPLSKSGECFMKIIKICNTKIGNAFFAIIMKGFSPIMNRLLAFTDEETPKIDIINSIKNFEKIQDTLKKII